MKVIDSNKHSENEIKEYTQLYEKLLEPFKFKGFSKEAFKIANLKNAIYNLPSKQKRAIMRYLHKRTYNYNYYISGIYELRKLNFRVLYDSEIIEFLRRAIDYADYQPLVAYNFVKLYDQISGCSYKENVSKKFCISEIENALDKLPTIVSDTIELSFGLFDGFSLSPKKVAKKLNITLDGYKELLNDGLSVLKTIYC